MAIVLIIGAASLMSPFIPRKYYRFFGLCVSLILAYFAFHIEVIKASDLYRHFEQIDLYREIGINLLIDDLKEMENPLTRVVYYLFSLLDNNRWFPSISVFIVYQLIFSLIIKIAKDENLSQKQIAVCTVFILINFNYYQLVYAVRMWLVFAIFAYCLYVEAVRKKNKILCWLIYILLIFFHYASIFLLICRVISFFVMNPPTNLRGLIISFAMLILVAAGFFYLFNSDLGTLMMDRYEGYLSYETRGTWQTINCWIRVIAVFCMAVYELLEIKNDKIKPVAVTVVLIFIMLLVFVGNYQMTLRFADGLITLSGCLLAAFIKPHKMAYSYPIWQLLFICATGVNILYLVIFDYRFTNFVF